MILVDSGIWVGLFRGDDTPQTRLMLSILQNESADLAVADITCWRCCKASYLAMITPQLILMHELLSDSGSIYVHLDWHVGHYVKLLMDEVFGKNQFRNEVIWGYGGGGAPTDYYPKKHDNLFWYSKSTNWTFNKQYRPYSEGTLQRGLTAVKGDQYQLSDEGAGLDDWWTDSKVQKILSPTAYENLKYATQKPMSLLAVC
ncbi:MAG: site-specific DNA-methyltransferase [Gallionellaceae bacterium]|nr:MAG: site-specific DNA-methyltransferase [Gallionellaceae bacterium]